jgi:hypothetical protein
MTVCHLRISRPWLGKYLRKKLGVTYRRIKPIKPIQNAPSAKLQRQLAAAKFIEALHSGKRIINIDESVLRYTDSRLRGWVATKQKNMVTSTSRLVWVNLIAALTSDGEVLYTVNIGKTNSYTFGFFLTKLTSYLDA